MKVCDYCDNEGGETEPTFDLVYVNGESFVIRHIAPQAPVHLLVIPRSHVRTIAGLTEHRGSRITSMLRAVQIAASQEGISETGFRLIIDQGKGDGHMHMHILGGGRPRELDLE